MTPAHRLVAMLVMITPTLACARRDRCESYRFDGPMPYGYAYQEAARIAAAKWSTFSGRSVRVADHDESESCIIQTIASNSDEYASFRDQIGSEFLAGHVESSGTIYIVPDLWHVNANCQGDCLRCATCAFMHEIAHEHGMRHVGGLNSIMSESSPECVTEYTSDDRIECERSGVCSR